MLDAAGQHAHRGEHTGRGREQHARRCRASRARSQACTGPEPPKASSVKSRGSRPRSTVTARMARTMLALTTSRMPSAASSTWRPSGFADVTRDRCPRRLDVERQRAAAEHGRQQAEHDIGVGHRRLRRRRGRSRPGRAARRPRRGPTAQQAAGVDRGDRAGAAADFGHVDRRHAHHVAAGLDEAAGRRDAGAEFIFMRAAERRRRGPARPRPWCRPCRRRRGRASPMLAPSRAAPTAPDARPEEMKNTGFVCATSAVDRPPLELPIRSGASMPISRKPCLESREIAAQRRQNVGVHHRGRACARTRRIDGRTSTEAVTAYAGKGFGKHTRGRLLVDGIHVGIEEADRDRTRCLRPTKCFARFDHSSRVERFQYRAVGGDALA